MLQRAEKCHSDNLIAGVDFTWAEHRDSEASVWELQVDLKRVLELGQTNKGGLTALCKGPRAGQ